MGLGLAGVLAMSYSASGLKQPQPMKHKAFNGARPCIVSSCVGGAIVCLLLVFGLTSPASARLGMDTGSDHGIHTSRTVVHKDGTYTATRRDANARTLTRETKHRNGTLVMRSEFLLDEIGQERKGQVYDGQGNLLFISEFVYVGGELIEERVFNSSGKPVRRLMYKMKVKGIDGRMKPAVVSYQNGRQIGELMPLDDPGVFSTTSSHANNPGMAPPEVVRSEDRSRARVDGGSFHYGSPAAAPAPAPRSRAATPGYRASSPAPKRRGLRIFKRRK